MVERLQFLEYFDPFISLRFPHGKSPLLPQCFPDGELLYVCGQFRTRMQSIESVSEYSSLTPTRPPRAPKITLYERFWNIIYLL